MDSAAGLGGPLSPLVIEVDATVVPLHYGSPHTFALGSLHQARLCTPAQQWRQRGFAALQDVCREAYARLSQRATPYFLTWYTLVAHIASAQVTPKHHPTDVSAGR